MKLSTLAPLCLVLLASNVCADTAVYDLDGKNAKEIAEAIDNALHARCLFPQNGNAFSQCRAELLSTGQLLVEAPAESQSQIAAVLKAIAARNASPTPRVTLQYWVLYGARGKPDAADPSLKPLNPVLQQLERAHGELGFSVQDTRSITAQSGTSASARGGALNINQTVRVNGDAIDLSAQVAFARKPVAQNLDISVTIRRGEFVVLGEGTAGEPGKDEPDEPEQAGLLFIVVHWPQGQ